MATPIITTAMSMADFMREYGESPFELIEGEKITVSPQAVGSARIAGRLFRRLADHLTTHQLGEAFIEAPFVLALTDDAQWVKGSRVPDVMFVRADRLAQLAADYPDWESMPLIGAPDFVAEVVSPTDRFSDVTRKVMRYLQDGVRLAWVIDASQQLVLVYTPDSKQQTVFSGDDVLTGGDVIPGFSLKTSALFEAL